MVNSEIDLEIDLSGLLDGPPIKGAKTYEIIYLDDSDIKAGLYVGMLVVALEDDESPMCVPVAHFEQELLEDTALKYRHPHTFPLVRRQIKEVE